MGLFDAWNALITKLADPGPPDEWQLLPDLHINSAGWLEGDDVLVVPSHPTWHYPRLSTPHGDPIAIVAHSSETDVGSAAGMANRRTKPRTKDDRPASWHISIEPDRIVQMVSCEAGAWHAIGAIKGAGPANRVSVGIEMIGHATQKVWPEHQLAQAARVWRALVRTYGIRRELALVPHAVIDPGRRHDPGAEFMRQAPRILAHAFG